MPSVTAVGQTKTVELTLPEQATVDDLRLLFKLSYSATYVRDNDALLDKPTRLRLAMLAQIYAFDDCVSEVIVSLGAHLSMKGALTLLDDLPEGVREHPAVPELRLKVIKTLATDIDKLADTETATAGSWECPGKALGPVHKLFGEGSDRYGLFYTSIPLKPFVKNLSVAAMGALLGSDKLQMAVEEEAYYPLGAYLHQSNHVTAAMRGIYFKALVENIRFHHISSDYLANVVTCCPLAIDSGLIPSFLRSALVYRDVDKELAGGYSVALSVRRTTEDRLGAFVYVYMPYLPAQAFKGCLERRAGLHYKIQLGQKHYSSQDLFRRGDSWGWSDFFKEPWDEVVCRNSDHFTRKLPVKVTMMKVKK